MAKLPDLFVNAVTTFDGKALTKGQKQISAFEKNVKTLGKSFAATFGAAALAQYSRNAVRAFASQQLEVAQLTTAVRNLGLAFATPEIDRYIDNVEAATGVNRDLLQPAMLKLLQVTGSVTKSQELLNLAMDVSAGTGTDLAKTSEILSQAYVGNFKGLRSLNLGLTQAELASTDFEKVQARLQVLFAGQAKVAADSYVGSMNKLAIASENASEKIGKSLLGALTALSGGKTVDDTISKIDKLSSAIAGLIDVTVGLKAGEYLQQYFALQNGRIAGGFGNRSLSAGNQDTQKADAKARAKAEADAAKRAKELLALQRKSAIAEKNKLALSKAAAVFDTTRISLAAALKATYDKETLLRLEALIAIEDENGEEALRKISQLAAFQKSADIDKLKGITEINDATLRSLNTQLLAELKVINDSKMAESEKEAARQIAFGKYNAAIAAAGELARKESYDERTQIQLTEIARLAALSNTSNAAMTLIKLRETSEINSIDKVAAAWKKAYDAQIEAEKYLTALKLQNINLVSLAENDTLDRKLRGYSSSALAIASLAATERQAAIAKLASEIGTASLIQGIQAGLTPAQAAVGARYAAQSAYNYYIQITSGIGDPEAIARTVSDVLNQSGYRGTSTNRDSGLYIL